eukprot:m.176938 g.176938  ORF g.176938 m.176938 type:complete len:84 (+) comp39150_c0_seq4:198-449(+)
MLRFKRETRAPEKKLLGASIIAYSPMKDTFLPPDLVRFRTRPADWDKDEGLLYNNPLEGTTSRQVTSGIASIYIVKARPNCPL